jgi:hypothetical protein
MFLANSLPSANCVPGSLFSSLSLTLFVLCEVLIPEGQIAPEPNDLCNSTTCTARVTRQVWLTYGLSEVRVSVGMVE